MLLTSNWNGQADTEQFLYWGSVGDETIGESHWSYVFLEVPEPSAPALAFLGGCVCLLRKRK